MSTDDPVEALSALAPEVEPPAGLEERILRGLRENGSFRQAPQWGRLAAIAALLAAVFAAGWLSGRAVPPRASPDDRYVLLLYGDVAGPETELVSEYAAWARAARAGGRQLTGERLDSSATVLGGGGSDPAAGLRGYFVFDASTMADAVAVARTHPHLRHGGRVVLRRILPT